MVTLCIQTNNTNFINFIEKEFVKSSESKYFKYSIDSKNSIKSIDVYYNLNKNYESFYDLLAKILSSLVVKYFQFNIIKNIIDIDYFYFSEYEKKIIIDEYKLINQNIDKNDKKNLKIDLIFNYIKEFIKNNNVINLEGFVNFRLYNYRSYLESQIEKAVNQYVIDKEYLKFVDLLRDYVDSKIPENNVVNLIYINSNGILLSENEEVINLKKFEKSNVYMSDISFSNNDFVLNTLIELLPARINLHLLSLEDQFIKTIKLIFGSRVHCCIKNCKICEDFKNKKIKENK